MFGPQSVIEITDHRRLDCSSSRSPRIWTHWKPNKAGTRPLGRQLLLICPSVTTAPTRHVVIVQASAWPHPEGGGPDFYEESGLVHTMIAHTINEK